MNRTITVNVVKEFARQDSQNGGIQGSGNVDHLRLRFSEDWDGYAKTCVFWDANGENPVKVIVGADKLEDVTKDPRTYIIDIPPEPLAVEGTYTVVIDGYLDGKRGRSETIRLKSNGAQIADDAGEPADPTPSQAEQLQQEIEKIIPNIQAVATEAKSWAVGGTGSRDGEDTDNAKYYAQQSEKSAQESAQGLENISQQVEAAKGYAESAKTESLHAANRAQSASESERNALESSESAKTAESNAKISEQSSAESARQSEEARQAIENMTASAVSVGPDAEPYVKKTSSGGVVNLEFGLRDGEPGPPGYTVPADGLYAFHIDENGDLIITYTGEEVPPFSIDENGDLIYTLAGNEVNIGHVVGGGGTGGTMNYTDLINKPRINGVELVGDKTTAELGIKDGQTPNITIGTVETLPAGNDVTASISGQTPNLVLNLGIPQGQKGDPGQATTVTVGTTTTGAPGSQASVVNSGTPNAAVLDFTIPAGEAGSGLPPTDTAHKGDVVTYDGESVVWETPSGEKKPMKLIAHFVPSEDTVPLDDAWLSYEDGTPFGILEKIVIQGKATGASTSTVESRMQLRLNGLWTPGLTAQARKPDSMSGILVVVDIFESYSQFKSSAYLYSETDFSINRIIQTNVFSFFSKRNIEKIGMGWPDKNAQGYGVGTDFYIWGASE